MRYWLEVARRTASDTQTLQPWRIYVAIGSALVSPFFHRVPGVTIYDLLISSVLSGLGVWGILILGEFAIRFAFMPSAIHREQKQEISRLQVSKGQFRAIIERMNILSHEIMLGRLTAAVVQIRS